MRRKKHKKSYKIGRMKRRGGIGALTSGITEIGGLLVGGIAASYVTNVLLKDFMPNTPLAKNVAPAVVGFAMSSFLKQPMLKSVGTGMIVVGGVNTVRSVVPAIGEVVDDIRGIEADINIGEDITIGELESMGELEIGEMTDTLGEINGSEELD